MTAPPPPPAAYDGDVDALHQSTGTACDEAGETGGGGGGESRAMALLTAVERSVLRALAFVFYQLERAQAQSLARAVLRWYFHLQMQLPAYAVASLERVAASVVALADAQFTSFWLSLLEKEIDDGDAEPPLPVSSGARACCISGCVGNTTAAEPRVSIQICSEQGEQDREETGEHELLQEREKTLAKRLYQHIYGGIRSLFFATRSRATQTPCTSPIDLSDESHYQPQQRYRRPFATQRQLADDSSAADDDACHRDDDDYYDARPHDRDAATGTASASAVRVGESEPFEPGWAVEYMEQESPVAAELTRRMRRMMHSSIPLNLFRVTVACSPAPCGGDDEGEDGFVGVVTPESFPPTPITRDLQTRRLHCYTASVLDHATLALRLLEASSRSSASSMYIR